MVAVNVKNAIGRKLMDKDLIRIIIFAIGLLVIMGMIAWSYIKHEKIKKNYHEYEGYDELSPEDEHSQLGHNEADSVEHHPTEGILPTDEAQETSALSSDNLTDVGSTSALKRPAIIQYLQGITQMGYSYAITQRFTLSNSQALLLNLSRNNEFDHAAFNAQLAWQFYF